MIDKNFGEVLGKSIEKYNHAYTALGHARDQKVDFESTCITDIAEYIQHLCGSIVFSNSSDLRPKRNNSNLNYLLSKVYSAYVDILKCYCAAVRKAIENVTMRPLRKA